MKTAQFTVRATEKQSLRWKHAASAEGFASVGSWAAEALDRYLDALKRSGRPLPLAWSKGSFRVILEDGRDVEVKGWLGRPFGLFRGTALGPGIRGCHLYTLAHLPTKRILATFRHASQCKALASDLSRLWIKWTATGSEPPAEDPAPLLQRFQREDV